MTQEDGDVEEPQKTATKNSLEKHMGVEPKIGFFLPPKSSHFNRVFHENSPSILGEPPYFWFNTHIPYTSGGEYV